MLNGGKGEMRNRQDQPFDFSPSPDFWDPYFANEFLNFLFNLISIIFHSINNN